MKSRSHALAIAGAVMLALAACAGARAFASTSAFVGTALQWRNIGPASFGVRVNAIDAPVLRQDGRSLTGRTLFLGGPFGIYKTDNAGNTWRSVFDAAQTLPVSALAVAPSNPKVVWAGTSDPVIWEREVSGSGVYKSEDGGEHWRWAGLRDSVLIAHLAIDPHNPDVVFVAVIGSRWHPSHVRGIYKTSDGGKTWRRTLYVNEWTAAVDVAVDPFDSQVVYAGTWQHAEVPSGFVEPLGMGSGIYRSSDGGETWHKLAGGLPTGKRGRTALALTPARDGRVYAMVYLGEPEIVTGYDGQKSKNDPEKAGIYLSDDRGDHWTKGATIAVGDVTMWGGVVADPVDADRVYAVHDGYLRVSGDAGKHFATLEQKQYAAVGGDEHALWINPDDPSDLWAGTDYGPWTSRDRGKTWRKVTNDPGLLYYTVAVDRRTPFYDIYGHAQDHGGAGAPSRTRSSDGIREADWFYDNGPEGDAISVDPRDPDRVYTRTNVGLVFGVSRFNPKTGQSQVVAPAAELSDVDGFLSLTNTQDILVSSRRPGVIYSGNRVLYRSTDGGDTWKALFADPGPLNGPPISLMGIIRPRYTEEAGVVNAIAESPVDDHLLYYGTNLGRIARSVDDGRTWQALHVPGISGNPQVSGIVASGDASPRAFVAFNSGNGGDFSPHVFETTNGGATWASRIAGLPPNGAVLSLVQHPANASLLFAGTDEGVFMTRDGGKRWVPLRDGMPHIRVSALAIQPDQNDLVAATWGRGIFVLDDITPLSENVPRMNGLPYIFPPRPTMQFRYATDSYGSSVDVERGDQLVFPNPPFGAPINYLIPQPAAASRATLEITDAGGTALATWSVSGWAGLHRATWDLNTHYIIAKHRVADIPVPPGVYRVRVRTGQRASGWRTFHVTGDPVAGVSQRDYDRQFAAALRATKMERRAYADFVALKALGARRQASGAPPAWKKEYDTLLDVFQPRVDEVSGLYFRRGIVGQLNVILAAIENAAGPPTATELASLDQIRQQLDGAERGIAALRASRQ